MAQTGPRLHGLVVWTCAAVALVLPTPAIGDQIPSSSGASAPSAPADFMLSRPRVTFGVRGNWIFASAGSDIYDFVTDTLTIEKSSFNAPAIGGEASVNITPRLDIGFGLEYSKQDMASEYRDTVERLPNGTTIPIVQTTSLQHSDFYVSAKFALLPRVRRISRFAWIPRSFVPYVGAGAGISKYNLEQDGDFVDFVDDHIFNDSFRSHGWTPSFHVFGGTDIQVYKRMFISLEGRYMWADAPLGPDFVDFDPIDLGGFRFGAGLHVVF
jgi:Outer membrane protein beta-barrel domain